MTGDTRLRDALDADLARVHDLLRTASLTTEGVDAMLLASTTVLESGNGLAGCACVERHGRFGLLRSVVVDPDLRGRDWGRALVANRLAWARAQDLETVFLFTETAAAFFGKLGFEPVARDDMPVEIQACFEFGFCPVSSRSMRLDL